MSADTEERKDKLTRVIKIAFQWDNDLLRRDVEEPRFRGLAAQVGHHPLSVLLAHLRVDRLSDDLTLGKVLHLLAKKFSVFIRCPCFSQCYETFTGLYLQTKSPSDIKIPIGRAISFWIQVKCLAWFWNCPFEIPIWNPPSEILFVNPVVKSVDPGLGSN